MAHDLNMNTRESTRQFNRSHGSFEIVFAPVILSLIGLWLDKKIGLTPLLTVSFAVFGLVGALVKVFYTYRFEMAQHGDQLGQLRAPHAPTAARDQAAS